MNKRYITLLILLALSTISFGQTVFNSLEEVWKYADDHNVAIKNSRYELNKAIDSKQQSYMAFLPQVGATGGFTDNTAIPTTLLPSAIIGKKDGSYTPVKFGLTYIYNAGLTAQMDIINVQTWFNTRIATETAEMNRASLANAHKSVYEQIASQYYAYILAIAATKLSEKSVAVADSIYISVAHKFTEGTANKANEDIAKLNLDRAQQTYITAQYQQMTAMNGLKILLDMSVTDSIIIKDMLQNNNDHGITASFAEDPAVRMAYYQTTINLSTYRSVNSGIIPTLTLGYSNSTQQSDNKFEPFQGGAPWYPSSYWSLKATWNIFTAGTRWLQSQKSKINYLESQLQYESAKKQADINDENLKLASYKTVTLYNKAKEVMDLSFDNYVHITYRYETGIASLEDRLTAFSDYINYQNQYLNSLSEMLVQQYNIKVRQKTF